MKKDENKTHSKFHCDQTNVSWLIIIMIAPNSRAHKEGQAEGEGEEGWGEEKVGGEGEYGFDPQGEGNFSNF